MPEPRRALARRAGEDAVSAAAGDPEVPKLPRGKGLKLSGAQLMRIALTAVTLLALVTLQRPCANAVGGFVATFGATAGSASPAAPAVVPAPGPAAPPALPALPSLPTGQVYERLTPSMTDDELRAAIERARRRAAAAEAALAPAGATAPIPGGAPAAPPLPAPVETSAPREGMR
jgi:hypothetical protein